MLLCSKRLGVRKEMKTTEEIVEMLFEIEIRRDKAKGTSKFNELDIEYKTLKWVLDYNG